MVFLGLLFTRYTNMLFLPALAERSIGWLMVAQFDDVFLLYLDALLAYTIGVSNNVSF